MDVLFSSEGIISLLTLTCLEIVLGVDNIIFISIICGKLPAEQREKARYLGLVLAMLVRIGLLFGISWLVSLEEDLIVIMKNGFSGRDLILLGGGLFLIAKSTSEIHDKFEDEEEGGPQKQAGKFAQAIVQIILIDIVFSFDSILTAVGLVKQVIIMIIAVVLSMSVMMLFAKKIADFVEHNPTLKMLALSFLVLIGFLLVVDAFGVHVPKGYVYFAMAFSLTVEMLNIRLRKRAKNKTIKDALLNDFKD